MAARLARLPFLVILLGLGALAMLPPALHAYIARDLHVARSFLYSGVLFLILFLLLAVALSGYRTRHPARSHLLALVGALTLLPMALAVPFHEAAGDVSWPAAWFEMVSSLTTTGATLFPAADRLPDTLHLWRAIVAWLGGFLSWVAAVAILSPLNLGGFEVIAGERQAGGAEARLITRIAEPSERLARFGAQLAPVYAGLSLALWIALVTTGVAPLQASLVAMSTLATSGIVAPGIDQPGLMAEAAIFVFLLLALSRITFGSEGQPGRLRALRRDPEMRTGLLLVVAVPLLLFLRHWWGAVELEGPDDLAAAGRALWGAAFTTLSFLTTTGFESAAFEDARAWSGLRTPGLALMGLALVGGGVATTAGGVKLLRIYALYKHGAREMEKLVHPSSVGGSGSLARRIRGQGAYMAWIFFMLFALSIALAMAALTLSGLSFENATVLSIAALSTTGPLAGIATDPPIAYADLGAAARGVVAAAMVLGRLETLALIALFNPGFWRR